MNTCISFLDIDTAIRHKDIEGLLELGAPQDEYSHVARIIADALADITEFTEDNITVVFTQVWAKHFNLSEHDIELRFPTIRNIAQYLMTQK